MVNDATSIAVTKLVGALEGGGTTDSVAETNVEV